jgi:hypothetical protein
MSVRTAVLGRATSNFFIDIVDVFTVPSTQTYIVKQLNFASLDGLNPIFVTVIAQQAGGGFSMNVVNQQIQPLALLQIAEFLVFGPGDTLRFVAGGTSGAKLWISGTELFGHV